MAEQQTDGLGVVIEVGDVVYHAPQKGTGSIALVHKVFPSGRITVKWPMRVAVHAYEQGAPQVPATRTRRKVDADGNPVMVSRTDHWGRTRSTQEWENYETLVDDYTVVGHRYVWALTQCAEYSRLVLRKADGRTTDELMRELATDYTAEVPNL
ncbi:hypothetical protein OHA79_09490 [Streptomyces sp. NBC_00841]|uniref:hypothetical protein n=1 Tax=Streptomyces sp. NBC_00841 TaxID=2975847 RepID=UPI002DDB0AE4|nr:hypothetical protein [Streptomyces sp. NBC_00841]WRZ98047.1 hypothetical protein OHA79_09490 [Streptomyces sp. NBC_00841]